MFSLTEVCFVAVTWLYILRNCVVLSCPGNCLCFKTTVRCMFLQLEDVPENVPAQTTVLDLRFNKIEHLPAGAFRGLDKLESILLNNNVIKTIDKDAFEGISQLQYLFLQNNNIGTLAPSTFSDLKNLRRLRLDSNALLCDCQMKWLSQMLKDNQGFSDVPVTCQSPNQMQGKSLVDMQDEEFHCERPKLTREPNDLEVGFGGTALFHCRAEGDPQPEIFWQHNNQQIKSNTIDGSSHYNVLDDGSLQINDIDASDEGVYECVAKNIVGEVKAKPVELRTGATQVRPQITVKPQDYSVVAGETVSLDCRASGQPPPAIHWTKNDLPLPRDNRYRQDGNIGTLVIQNINFNDRGLYRCTATNSEGSTSETGRVEVLIGVTFKEEPSDQSVIVGQSVYFVCRADGNPKPKISWLKNGRQIEEDPRHTLSAGGSTLWITQVKLTDRGVYECQAQNEAGVNLASAQLLVKQRLPPTLRSHPQPAQAFVGANVRFQCSVSADPPPSITWFKNGAALSTSAKYEIQANEESLLIRNVVKRDEGTYQCIAENVAGSVRAFATLTVLDNNFNSVIDNDVISQTVDRARNEVDQAINRTLTEFRGRSRPRTPQDLLALFRQPSLGALEITRSAEIFERTLESLHNQMTSGAMYNISHDEIHYEDILTPLQLAIVANLSNCAAHRRVSVCTNMCFHDKYRTFDGTCNNLRHPMWGASLTPLNRLLPPSYENGFNTPRGWNPVRQYNGNTLPSARVVSLKIMSAKEVTEDVEFTHMLMQWGQFLDHDITFVPMAVSNARFSDGRHCNETCGNQAPCFPIMVPDDDPRIRRHRCIGVTRSSAMCGSGMTSVFFQNPIQREQINQITSYIDASNVYGSGEDESQRLRDFSTQTGYLRTGLVMPSGKPLLPPNNGEPVDCQMDPNKAHIPCFQAGDHRANEQLGLLSMHTLFMREHNRIAEALRRFNPHWDGDMLYHEARKIVGAEMQHISYEFWLPKILGPKGMQQLGEYQGYDPMVDSTIINSFATAAFRFGHGLINPVIYRLNSTYSPIREGNLPLHKAFFAPYRIVEEGGMDPVLRGLIGRSAKQIEPGELLNRELTERLFKLAHEVALDLGALNVQRGRDHGLPTYNDMREHCGLRKATTFAQFQEIENIPVRQKLRSVYGHPDNVDLFVGAMAETPVAGAKVGPTLMCIIVEQFKRLRDGDRFWYKNPGVFSPSQLLEIQQVTLSRVICDNADSISLIQKDPFIKKDFPSGYLQCEGDIPKMDLKVWTHCCQDCSRAGSFHSLTSHFRGKRSAVYSDDKELSMVDIPEGTSESEQKDIIGDEGLTEENMLSERLDFKISESFENLAQDAQKPSDIVHMSKTDLDALKRRLNGMEDAMESMEDLIKDLTDKLKHMEDHMTTVFSSGDSKVGSCQDFQGQVRQDRDKWKENGCKVCECIAGVVECSAEVCPTPACDNPKDIDGHCCPICD